MNDLASDLTVLVVEDSLIQAEVLRRSLDGRGLHVLTARDGQQGLERARRQRPDVVISDINMPVMDGYELCQALRGEDDPALAATPVILLTVMANPVDVIRGLQSGADAYITKPFHVDRLVATIRQLLDCSERPSDGSLSIRLEDGSRYEVQARRRQLLTLLVSTYENAVQQYKELERIQEDLVHVNQKLEKEVLERRRAADALSELNRNLEERVRGEVTRNTEQERLLMRQSRFATMGEMIGNIAHQWRQPLSALQIVLANILDAHELGELDRALLEKLVQDGDRIITGMSATIDDFRDFFRPDKAPREFRLVEPVERARGLVANQLRAAGVELHCDETSLGERLEGFPNEFAHVLLNLFSNSCDAARERGRRSARLEVRSRGEPERVIILVTDNAGGIPDEVLPRIFEPYYTTREKGTGIGLYMSRMIMEHMGGSIDAGNVEGGACFRIELPRTAVQGRAAGDGTTAGDAG